MGKIRNKQNFMPNPKYRIPKLDIKYINIIEKFNLGFNLGTAIEYILQADNKDSYTQDLGKAMWYLNREIELSKNKEK